MVVAYFSLRWNDVSQSGLKLGISSVGKEMGAISSRIIMRISDRFLRMCYPG